MRHVLTITFDGPDDMSKLLAKLDAVLPRVADWAGVDVVALDCKVDSTHWDLPSPSVTSVIDANQDYA